jgi:hypothetical protein
MVMRTLGIWSSNTSLKHAKCEQRAGRPDTRHTPTDSVHSAEAGRELFQLRGGIHLPLVRQHASGARCWGCGRSHRAVWLRFAMSPCFG